MIILYYSILFCIILMSKLSLKSLELYDNINTETTTCIRTPEPSEACELGSMYLLYDLLWRASLNNLVSQERCKQLSEY